MRSDTSIQVQVNGESRTAPAGSTVSGLLKQLDIRSDRVAVEVNLQILDRQCFDRQMLQEGDRVEIISFIGGGSGVGGRSDDLRARRTRTSDVLVRCAQLSSPLPPPR